MRPTVEQILNEHARRHNHDRSDIHRCAAIVEPICDLVDGLVAAAEAHGNDPRDWTMIRERIFARDDQGIASTAYRSLDDAGIEFPGYEHPQGSCEEVAFAWIRTFRSVMEEVRARVAGTTPRTETLQDEEPLRAAA